MGAREVLEERAAVAGWWVAAAEAVVEEELMAIGVQQVVAGVAMGRPLEVYAVALVPLVAEAPVEVPVGSFQT